MTYSDDNFDSGCGSDYSESLSEPEFFEESGEYCDYTNADGPAENAEPPAVARCCGDIGGEHYYVASVTVRATITWLGREIIRDGSCNIPLCQFDARGCAEVEAACKAGLDKRLQKESWYKFAKIEWSIANACEIVGHTCPSSIPAAPTDVNKMY